MPNVKENSKAFKIYAQSYIVEVLDSRDSTIQFYITKRMLKINSKI